MLAGGLYNPSSSAIGTIANSLQPAVANEIGQYAKAHNSEGTLGHSLSHAALAASTAYLSGNDALSAALSAGGAEVAAPILAHNLYGKEAQELSAQEKDNIASLSGLLGSAVGASTGNSTNIINSSMAASNAVENNFLGTISQATLEKSREKILKGTGTVNDAQNVVDLNRRDQENDYLLDKYRSRETLTEQEETKLNEALYQYYLEIEKEHGTDTANQLVRSLLEEPKGYRPLNYVYPFSGTKAQQEQWKAANKDKITWYSYNQGSIGEELSKADGKARSILQGEHITNELGNIGMPAVELTTGGLGYVIRGLSAFNSGATVGEGVNQIYTGHTADGVLNVVSGVLGVVGTAGAGKVAAGYVRGTGGGPIPLEIASYRTPISLTLERERKPVNSQTSENTVYPQATFLNPKIATEDNISKDYTHISWQIDDNATSTGHGIHYNKHSTAIGDDAATINNFNNVNHSNNGHNVIVHGQPYYDEKGGTPILQANTPAPIKRDIEIEPNLPLSVEQVAEAVRMNPNYVEGTPICFGSCWSGSSGTAQQLANEMGVPVYAPTRPVRWDKKSNQWVIDGERESIQFGNSDIKPEWKMFYPKK